jgi:RNA polymerase sigma factor (TIGR02999 family)
LLTGLGRGRRGKQCELAVALEPFTPRVCADQDAGGLEALAHEHLTRQTGARYRPVMKTRHGPDADVSGLLQAWGAGDVEARDRLIPLVYQELRRRAAAYLRHERPGHCLQPTALVHEAYLRLVMQDRVAWQNRAQFFGVAAQMMRRILVDRARARKMAKRSGRWMRVTMDEAVAKGHPREVELLDLDEALTDLAVFDARKSQVAELRFFGGLSLDETGQVLSLSVATVEREWQAARAWLYARLTHTTRP